MNIVHKTAKNMLQYESLHNHTTLSDGEQSHLEVLATAEKNNVGVVAFTDHDALPDQKILNDLTSYTGPVKWLVGCEISSGLPKELGGKATSMFHILGLFVDPHNEALREYCTRAIQARNERMHRIVDNLTSIGFTITAKDCLRASGGESVGRPHIVKALFEYEKNKQRIQEIARDMKEEARNNTALREQYTSMTVQRKEGDLSQYPYTLFLSDDSYIKNIYVDYLYSIDMDTSVKLIRDAGGVAILAHWGTVSHKIDRAMLETFLKEKRLDGIEIASGFDIEHSGPNPRLLHNLAIKYDTLETIGIDAHKAEDFQKFANAQQFAKKTIGITQRILHSANITPTWSNLASAGQ